MFLFLSLVLALGVRDSPNLALTPGKVRPINAQEICHPEVPWGKDNRAITDAMKRHVTMLYGLLWVNRGDYEYDHLFPRSLGGADDVLNLWPQPWSSAYTKDAFEQRMWRSYCAGNFYLPEVQALFCDWVAGDKKFPRASKGGKP